MRDLVRTYRSFPEGGINNPNRGIICPKGIEDECVSLRPENAAPDVLTVLLSSILFLVDGPSDTLSLAPARVFSVKGRTSLEKLAAPSSRFTLGASTGSRLQNPHSLSALIPGLQIPEYGASLTSTIYIRGLGSRMENPALSLYVDDIPVLDKNAYDFDWYGLQAGTLLRGPQGSLYGRNAMGGVLVLRSPSALETDGWQGLVEAGWPGTLHLGVSGNAGTRHHVSGSFRLRKGYFINQYTGKTLDPYAGGLLRWRWDGEASASLRLSNALHVNYSDEGGFAYGRYLDGEIHPVNYNDEGSYRRLSVLDGFKVQYLGEHIRLTGVSSLQLLTDRMRMDQDYTPESIFTLEQKQRSAALTQEIILTPTREFRHWKPQTGFFAFGKLNRMTAPVVFKEDGIRSLILDNANRNIPADLGYLDISEKTFPVNSGFWLGSWNAALYHESVWELGRWLLTAGVRLDYEGGTMDYDSQALIHYRFVPIMKADKPFKTSYKGVLQQHHFQVLPKLSVLYEALSREGATVRVYGNVTKGFRAGGFNTQIFSDILQGLMMTGMMADLGVYFDTPRESVTAQNTQYRPEEAWNYELGLRFRSGSVFSAEVNAYYIDCLNQQLTVFPPGKTTGRMMTNAGRSRSMGVETELDFHKDWFHSHLSYSFCDARFREYIDGTADYSGKRISYVPQNSFYAGADASFNWLGRAWLASAELRGWGPIWWNEDNSRYSPAALTLGAMLGVSFRRLDLYVRAENLLGRQYPAFYFKSIGHEFFALSKPGQFTLGISFKLL